MYYDEESGETITFAQRLMDVQDQKAAADQDLPPQPRTNPQPPADTDPGPDAGDDVVDEAYVESAAAKVLPDAEASREYRAQAIEGVWKQLADDVIARSGLDVAAFAEAMKRTVSSITTARAKLDTKDVPGSEEPHTPGEYEPLPGVVADPACTSLFDVNDLALRGRRSVSGRTFNQPLVMLDAFLGAAPEPDQWLFGQKLEWQQEWRHAGFTLGEFVSSQSLLPGEELTIEVSSFQRTRQEIASEAEESKRLQLAVEQRNTDERSCSNATAADNGWSVSASASINYPIASASVSASAYGNSSEQAEQSRRQLNEATLRSTSDQSSRRAVKVTQTTEAGSEATTTRRLRNPNPCQTVTYNFFQVVKLYDIQLCLVDSRPTLLFPSLLPRVYGPKEARSGQLVRPTEVQIPVHLIEGWHGPAVFLTRYFEVDRELSRQVSGWALRLRADFSQNPEQAARLWAEALVVAAKFLFKADPADQLARLGSLFSDYCDSISTAWSDAADRYGRGLGTSAQINTGGLYVDALRGRCTACTDHEEAEHYVEAMTGLEELRRLRKANELDDQEIRRRKRRLAVKDLDPFDAAAPTP